MDGWKEVLTNIKEGDIVNLVKQLVRIPSRNPPGEEKAIAEFIATLLMGWGFEVELVEPMPDRPDVIAWLRGTEGHPTLILNGHIDVVPEGNPALWSTFPFEATVKEGKLFGRGVADQKSGLATMIIAAKAIKDAGVKLRGNLVLTFVSGEETSEPGTKYLFTERKLKGDWGIVTEPTSTKSGLKVATAECGLAYYHIIVKGKSVHASRPHMGINAINKAMKVVHALDRYHQEIGKRQHPLIAPPRCTVTMIKGGVKENIVPEECVITIDRRMIPTETVTNVEGELRGLLENIRKEDPEFNYDIKFGKSCEAVEIPLESEIAKVVKKNLKKVTGIDPEPWATPYSCDVRNFITDASIPAVVFGPGDVVNCHCANEWVEIEEVVTATKVLALTALELLS
jgi:succinyl-diaminopimelate desuccinylase